jgi:hypothetical protein
MGKARRVIMIRGQIPFRPASIGRKRVPAPIAVPYKLSIQIVSCLFQEEQVAAEVDDRIVDDSFKAI